VTPSAPPGKPSGIISTLKDDVRLVAADVRERGGSRTIGDTLASLEAFYLTADERRELEAMRPFRRLTRRVAWFIRGLLMKLTPVRRIMLAAALVLLVTGIQRVDIERVHMTLRFSLTGSLLLFAVLVLELKDKLTARDELEAGRAVQLAMLPREAPAIPTWDVWFYSKPANDVGGDVLDHLPLDDTRHGVALGDVAGKALPAALLSVKLQATLRALAPQSGNLGELGAAANRILFRDGLPTRFASLVYLILPTDSGRVRMLNAGHMPPLLVRQDTVTATQPGGMVLGIVPEAPFVEQVLDVEVGDVLIVYSDGVSEAMNDGGDFFDDERLVAAAVPTGSLTSRQIGTRILDAVTRFIGHARQNDDISLMVIRRLAPGDSAAPTATRPA
jgi:serine phosphatase RsbU (regulator of sigma subunit)